MIILPNLEPLAKIHSKSLNNAEPNSEKRDTLTCSCEKTKWTRQPELQNIFPPTPILISPWAFFAFAPRHSCVLFLDDASSRHFPFHCTAHKMRDNPFTIRITQFLNLTSIFKVHPLKAATKALLLLLLQGAGKLPQMRAVTWSCL